MSSTELDLKSLYLLSDGLASDFAQQVEECVRDCRQRPSIATKREVTLKLTIIPHPEDPDDVLIEPVTTRKTPARKIPAVRGRTNGHNQLKFNFHDEDL